MQPQLASVLFRFRPESGDSAFVALLNQRIGDVLLASGSANVGVTEADGVTCLKMTLLNPTVCLDDVIVLLTSVKETAEALFNAE
jgi:L-2,4-diaminobutyrate decarboxylase